MQDKTRPIRFLILSLSWIKSKCVARKKDPGLFCQKVDGKVKESFMMLSPVVNVTNPFFLIHDEEAI